MRSGEEQVIILTDEQIASFDLASLMSLFSGDSIKIESTNEKAESKLEDILQLSATKHDFKKVLALLEDDKDAVNLRHSKTGRTVLHNVANCPHHCEGSKTFFHTLINEYKADVHIRDNEGYTPAEILMHPHQYNTAETIFYSNLDYCDLFFIGELNAKLNAAGHNKRLELVDDTSQMIEFAKNHPDYTQIGFLVKRPNCLKSNLVVHYSPIVFDRDAKLFVQLDSFGGMYVMPNYEDARFIYSTISRQVSDVGCRKDAIHIAYTILRDFPDFFKYSQSHAVERSDVLSPFTPKEETERSVLKMITYSSLTKDQKKRASYLSNKQSIQEQLAVFTLHKVAPISNVHALSTWPVELALFLERYDLMMPLRTSKQLGEFSNQRILKKLVKHGMRRTPVSDNMILANLKVDVPDQVPDKKYDIAGINFKTRHENWLEYRKTRAVSIKGIFSKRIYYLVRDEERNAIVDNIIKFSGLT
ncbi:MAG: hypothetical protein ABI597_00890 [Gammaproteobacteria bacterium]